MLLVTILSFQAGPTTLDERAIDDTSRLRVVVSAGRPMVVRVHLVDKTNADRFWELARVTEPYELNFKVERADSSSVVLSRTTDYGIQEGFIKLFIDMSSKRLLKRIDFKSHEREDYCSTTWQHAGPLSFRLNRPYGESTDRATRS